MDLNERLTVLRKSKGLTQEAMAQKLLVSRQTIYKWESGKAQPDLQKFSQICRLFDISADLLLSESFDPETQKAGASPPEPTAAEENISEIAPMAVSTRSIVPAKRRVRIFLGILALVLIAAVLASVTERPDKEIIAAQEAGIIGANIQADKPSIRERDFLQMLLSASKLRHHGEIAALANAAECAGSQWLTREKAAYWLYCTHVWTTIDANADMAIDSGRSIDPISRRNVYEELNEISRAKVDTSNEPWDAFICEETRKANSLFEIYDGSAAMDAQIIAILNGSYYTAVTFCASQCSFDTEKPLMELSDNRFRTKDRISAKEAIHAVVRLYLSW